MRDDIIVDPEWEEWKKLRAEEVFVLEWNKNLPPVKWKVLNKTAWVADTPRSRKKAAGEPSHVIEAKRGIIT